MAAIDAPPFAPPFAAPESRKVAVTIGASLLLHALLLAWLPPLVRDAGRALPSILEVRLLAVPAAADPKPMARAEPPPRSPKPTPAAPKAAPADMAVASEPVDAAPVAEPDPSTVADSAASPALAPAPAPVSEPVTVTPPDLRAAYLSNPRPPYPLAARRLGLEGRVVLRAEILDNGSCGRISISHSSGYEVLDQAALAAVKQWRFVPARRGAEAVTAWVEVPVAFRLDRGET